MIVIRECENYIKNNEKRVKNETSIHKKCYNLSTK